MDDDLPPDLPRLRILETWPVLSLGRVREQIAVLERPAGPGPHAGLGHRGGRYRGGDTGRRGPPG